MKRLRQIAENPRLQGIVFWILLLLTLLAFVVADRATRPLQELKGVSPFDSATLRAG